MKLFVNIYNDADLLSHFLAHYHNAGVNEFFISASPAWQGVVSQYAARFHIHLVTERPAVEDDLYGSSAISAMRRRHQAPDEWVTIVDLDEFIEFPVTMETLVADAERDGANVVRGIMHDRFAFDGGLPEIAADTDLAGSLPVKSRFIRDVMGGYDHKGVLVKGHLQAPPRAGHHWFADERVAKRALEISHYKWIAGSVDRLRQSYRIVAERGIGWAAEYRRALDHFDTHGKFEWQAFGGRPATAFVIEDPPRCADCGAPVSEAELAYSGAEFGRALCRSDQAMQRRREMHGGCLRARSRQSG